jgi:hypothetical protein
MTNVTVESSRWAAVLVPEVGGSRDRYSYCLLQGILGYGTQWGFHGRLQTSYNLRR